MAVVMGRPGSTPSLPGRAAPPRSPSSARGVRIILANVAGEILAVVGLHLAWLTHADTSTSDAFDIPFTVVWQGMDTGSSSGLATGGVLTCVAAVGIAASLFREGNVVRRIAALFILFAVFMATKDVPSNEIGLGAALTALGAVLMLVDGFIMGTSGPSRGTTANPVPDWVADATRPDCG